FQTGRRFYMEIQPQLVLLQKTLLNIEGLGRDLYPELDLWKTAKPFMERWMHEQNGFASALRRIRKEPPNLSECLPGQPARIIETLEELIAVRQQLQRKVEELQRLKEEEHRGNRRHVSAIGGGALVLSAAVMLVGEASLPCLLPTDESAL